MVSKFISLIVMYGLLIKYQTTTLLEIIFLYFQILINITKTSDWLFPILYLYYIEIKLDCQIDFNQLSLIKN